MWVRDPEEKPKPGELDPKWWGGGAEWEREEGERELERARAATMGRKVEGGGEPKDGEGPGRWVPYVDVRVVGDPTPAKPQPEGAKVPHAPSGMQGGKGGEGDAKDAKGGPGGKAAADGGADKALGGEAGKGGGSGEEATGEAKAPGGDILGGRPSCGELASALYRGLQGHTDANRDCTCRFSSHGERLDGGDPRCPVNGREFAREALCAASVVWPYALPPRQKAKREEDALAKMGKCVAVAPVVTDVYYERAEGGHHRAKAKAELQAAITVKPAGSVSLVPLVFGKTGMPEVWRGPIADALGGTEGVDCTAEHGLDKAMEKLEGQLRGLGIAPRGEKSRKAKEEKEKEQVEAKKREEKEQEEVQKWDRMSREAKEKAEREKGLREMLEQRQSERESKDKAELQAALDKAKKDLEEEEALQEKAREERREAERSRRDAAQAKKLSEEADEAAQKALREEEEEGKRQERQQQAEERLAAAARKAVLEKEAKEKAKLTAKTADENVVTASANVHSVRPVLAGKEKDSTLKTDAQKLEEARKELEAKRRKQIGGVRGTAHALGLSKQ